VLFSICHRPCAFAQRRNRGRPFPIESGIISILHAVEFDAAKSAANKIKHGIDFIEAQAIWLDPDRIELPARSTDEPRFLIVGQIRQALWTAAVTYRHEETIRLISIRRARDSEKREYIDAREAGRDDRDDPG
jgi:uncharacterized DUF497 family protein